MKFELTNNDRKYLGLVSVQDNWELVQIDDDLYLYFDGDTIVKSIIVNDTLYVESELNQKTEDRKFILPKTNKGKPKKLNYAAYRRLKRIGTYFHYTSNYDFGVEIANYTTRKSFFNTFFEQIRINDYNKLRAWLDKFIKESTDKDLEDISNFSKEKRNRFEMKEGDFFRFKIGRNQFGFGRITFKSNPFHDVNNLINDINNDRNNEMGKTLVIKIYHLISNQKNIDIETLKTLPSFPSQYLVNNNFLYGEFEIIGNIKLNPNELDFPISYSNDKVHGDELKIYLQWGLIYFEEDRLKFDKFIKVKNPSATHEYNMFVSNPYKHCISGYTLHLTKNVMEKCIKEKNNDLYWKQIDHNWDLRNPKNNKEKREIFKHFGLNPKLSYNQNLDLLNNNYVRVVNLNKRYMVKVNNQNMIIEYLSNNVVNFFKRKIN